MENAAKALLIAGGILLAMMILALLVYGMGALKDLTESQERAKEAQQIAEFNNSYLAYNKNRMYGTDVITVVNKAINHNSKLDTEDEDQFINITIKIIQDFKATTVVTKTNEKNETLPKEKTTDDTKRSLLKTEHNGEYSLKKKFSSTGTDMEQKVLDFFIQDMQDTYERKQQGNLIIETRKYSALTTFKRAIFMCTNIDYDNNGRIISMTFEQIEINNDYL